MEKIITALKSRTVWTIIVLFLISGVQGVSSFIPANLLEPIQGLLALLAVYFRVNPRV